MSSTTPTTTSSPLTKTLNSLKSAWKSHHESVTAAYETYYGGSPRATPTASQATSARTSEESVRAEGDAKVQGKKESGVRKSLEGLKRRVQEHHQSVNAAYVTYYGAHGGN